MVSEWWFKNMLTLQAGHIMFSSSPILCQDRYFPPLTHTAEIDCFYLTSVLTFLCIDTCSSQDAS